MSGRIQAFQPLLLQVGEEISSAVWGHPADRLWGLPPAASSLQGKGKGQLLFPGQPTLDQSVRTRIRVPVMSVSCRLFAADFM